MTEWDYGTSVDWTKCISCQETTTEPLQCPGNSQTSYHTLASNSLQYSEIRSFNFEKLDEGGGSAELLKQQKPNCTNPAEINLITWS